MPEITVTVTRRYLEIIKAYESRSPSFLNHNTSSKPRHPPLPRRSRRHIPSLIPDMNSVRLNNIALPHIPILIRLAPIRPINRHLLHFCRGRNHPVLYQSSLPPLLPQPEDSPNGTYQAEKADDADYNDFPDREWIRRAVVDVRGGIVESGAGIGRPRCRGSIEGCACLGCVGCV